MVVAAWMTRRRETRTRWTRGVRRGVRAGWFAAAPCFGRGAAGGDGSAGCARGDRARGSRATTRSARRGGADVRSLREDEPRVDGCVDWTARWGEPESSRLAAPSDICARSGGSLRVLRVIVQRAGRRGRARELAPIVEVVETVPRARGAVRHVARSAEGAGEGTMKQRLLPVPARTRGGFSPPARFHTAVSSVMGGPRAPPNRSISAHTRSTPTRDVPRHVRDRVAPPAARATAPRSAHAPSLRRVGTAIAPPSPRPSLPRTTTRQPGPWRPPDGSNPLEGPAGPSPIPSSTATSPGTGSWTWQRT